MDPLTADHCLLDRGSAWWGRNRKRIERHAKIINGHECGIAPPLQRQAHVAGGRSSGSPARPWPRRRRTLLPAAAPPHAVRASLLAKATTATFVCTRCVSARSEPPRGVALVSSPGRADRAPWISSLRRYLLPRLVMPTRRGLPLVVTWRGTRPSRAARSRQRAFHEDDLRSVAPQSISSAFADGPADEAGRHGREGHNRHARPRAACPRELAVAAAQRAQPAAHARGVCPACPGEGVKMLPMLLACASKEKRFDLSPSLNLPSTLPLPPRAQATLATSRWPHPLREPSSAIL